MHRFALLLVALVVPCAVSGLTYFGDCVQDFQAYCPTEYSNALTASENVETLFVCMNLHAKSLSTACQENMDGQPVYECASDAQLLCANYQENADSLRYCLLSKVHSSSYTVSKPCHEALYSGETDQFGSLDHRETLQGSKPSEPVHHHHGHHHHHHHHDDDDDDEDGDWDHHHDHGGFFIVFPAVLVVGAMVTCFVYRRRRRRTLRAIRRQQQAMPQYHQVNILPTAPPMPAPVPVVAARVDQPGAPVSDSVQPGSLEMSDYSQHMPPMSNRGTGYVRVATTEN